MGQKVINNWDSYRESETTMRKEQPKDKTVDSELIDEASI